MQIYCFLRKRMSFFINKSLPQAEQYWGLCSTISSGFSTIFKVEPSRPLYPPVFLPIFSRKLEVFFSRNGVLRRWNRTVFAIFLVFIERKTIKQILNNYLLIIPKSTNNQINFHCYLKKMYFCISKN